MIVFGGGPRDSNLDPFQAARCTHLDPTDPTAHTSLSIPLHTHTHTHVHMVTPPAAHAPGLVGVTSIPMHTQLSQSRSHHTPLLRHTHTHLYSTTHTSHFTHRTLTIMPSGPEPSCLPSGGRQVKLARVRRGKWAQPVSQSPTLLMPVPVFLPWFRSVFFGLLINRCVCVRACVRALARVHVRLWGSFDQDEAPTGTQS